MIEPSYAKRSGFATPFAGLIATECGLARFSESFSYRSMFDRYAFLDRVLQKAPTRQAVLEVLGLPSSRGPELFNREHVKPRKLKLEEAVKLSDAFGVPITGDMASAESLLPVLRVCLRHAPKEWTERELQRLSEEIERGLQLLQALEPKHDSLDRSQEVADDEARPSVDRLD